MDVGLLSHVWDSYNVAIPNQDTLCHFNGNAVLIGIAAATLAGLCTQTQALHELENKL